MNNSPPDNGDGNEALAFAIRDACVQTALNAYENARMDGLCHDGAWEGAGGAMRVLNVRRIMQEMERKGS